MLGVDYNKLRLAASFLGVKSLNLGMASKVTMGTSFCLFEAPISLGTNDAGYIILALLSPSG